MEISRRTDYAIRLIAALTESGGRPLSVRKAAADYDVPYAFARNIQHDLVQAGILQAVRGSQGGMLLAIDPADLTLYHLIETLQGPISIAVCAADPAWCNRSSNCQFHQVWLGAELLLKDYLSSVSIEELLSGEKACLTSSSKLFFKKEASVLEGLLQ